MKITKLLIIASLLAVSSTNAAYARGYVKDFEVEYDEPYCIVETDYVTMEVNSIEVEDDYLTLDTLVTNSNTKRDYEVCVKRASVDGIEIYPAYREDVEADDENDEPIEIDLSNVLDNADITDITDIELEIAIEDDDMEKVYEDTIHIYPYGEDKAIKYERKAEDSDIVIVDDEKFKVSVTEFEYVEDWGYSIHMYIQNKTGGTIFLEGEDYKLNDTDADTWYDEFVGANGTSFSRLEWSQADLDDAGVTEVTKVAFNLSIYDEGMDNLLYGTTVILEP